MLGDGVADAATIDRVVRLGGGFRMGPFELIDLIGLDVNLDIARSFYAQGGEPERWRPSPIQERLVEEGQLGRKSGAGLLLLRRGQRPRADPELGSRRRRSTPSSWRRSTRRDRVLPRLFAQIANEAAFALEEGVASAATWTRRCGSASTGRWARSAGRADRHRRRAVEVLEREAGAAYALAPLLRQAAG